MLEGAGRNLNYGTFEQAGEHLGTFTVPGSPAPFHYGPPPSTDGDPSVYVYRWSAPKRTFVLDSNG
jgi:hypothetical protein